MTETKARFTPERLNELEQLARAATPGPWEVFSAEDIEVHAQAGERICHAGVEDDEEIDEIRADAAFIAAFNPATVLALLSEVRALRERLPCSPRRPLRRSRRHEHPVQ